jgi:hypothetical protein
MGKPISIIGVRASPPMRSVSTCTLKSDEENSTYPHLTQENGFSPACLLSLSLLRLVKSGSNTVDLLAKSVINMFGLLLPVFDWPIIMIHLHGFLSVVPTYLQSPFQFYS